ncbi:hypothetical protein MGALJ_21670 [Mycobacterium gallinarum]|uniref:Uncharacterized protein n=1 Tax=Mycobacterium gallinarum TaxID=39689 RepID=A0A9W4FF74_9MYCO|nr:hypothetical protein MGALJ_21670 [Mycobacterium gallinarum]
MPKNATSKPSTMMAIRMTSPYGFPTIYRWLVRKAAQTGRQRRRPFSRVRDWSSPPWPGDSARSAQPQSAELGSVGTPPVLADSTDHGASCPRPSTQRTFDDSEPRHTRLVRGGRDGHGHLGCRVFDKYDRYRCRHDRAGRDNHGDNDGDRADDGRARAVADHDEHADRGGR